MRTYEIPFSASYSLLFATEYLLQRSMNEIYLYSLDVIFKSTEKQFSQRW